MIHDALLILWDCTDGSEDPELGPLPYANEGDEEIYNRICAIAKDHHAIQKFVASTSFQTRKYISASGVKTHGLYGQAFSEGISEVLQLYKQTLVEVETLVIGNQNYTLSFVYSYVEKYRGLFNVLNKIIATVKERRLTGCQILSLVHQYILSGNEMVHEAILKIFVSINSVFINQLCTWLLYGELMDPYEEFFIVKVKKTHISDTFLASTPSSGNNSDKSLVSTLQHTPLDCGYHLNPNMIPYFMPLSLAQEIQFIGKTVILFGFDPKNVKKTSSSFTISSPLMSLQKNDNDSKRFTIWEEKESEFHEKLHNLKKPEVFEVCNLRAVVHEIKECVTKHLWTVAVEEAALLHELRLMQQFYLLGRGELFRELLRRAAPLLDRPPARTSTRDLNHAFQLAARAVLLGGSADVDKFSFELPYTKPDAANSVDDDSATAADGWSTIVLRYEFKWPLHLVFSPAVLARYNDVFRLLLRIKNTQRRLHALWKTYKHSARFSSCQLHNKLMFLVDSLQHYLHADVLATHAGRLAAAVANTNDFEVLKKAHATFLADVLSQTFLTVTPSSDTECSSDVADTLNNPVLAIILQLLRLADGFCALGESAGDRDEEDYYVRGYNERYFKLVQQLLRQLEWQRGRAGGGPLARLLVRLDYNRWLSAAAAAAAAAAAPRE